MGGRGYGQGSNYRQRASGKGRLQRKIGKVTGDAKTQADGTAEKSAGKVRNAIGGVKNAVRRAPRRPRRGVLLASAFNKNWLSQPAERWRIDMDVSYQI
jgi:uncharacterized protein YjbJ (UPF0337 family)